MSNFYAGLFIGIWICGLLGAAAWWIWLHAKKEPKPWE